MANYWEERFKRLKTAEMRKAERANADLARVYRETLRQLRAEVEQWYDRFAKENKISLAEARRILDNRELKEFKMTLADFIKEAKRLDLDPAHIRMLENASMRVRLTRSQEIYLKTAQYVEKLAKSQGWQLSGLMREVYTDSVYKTAYETQKVTGFENFRAVRERQIEEAISKPWAPDGADFSSRIWKNKTQLINSLQTDITQSLMTGTSTAQLSEKIAARFNTSYNQAYRLVETETAYIQERAMLDTYDELGLEQYQICAVLDSKTSEICQNLDGKVFDRKDAKPGITMPPFHCHCRSTTVPYIEGLLDDGGRVARDPVTGKTVEIPDMTYKEWKAEYVDKTKAAEDGKIEKGSIYTEAFNNSTPKAFSYSLKEAKKTVEKSARWRVTGYDEAHYKGVRLHVTRGGSTVAVDNTGDIISVCYKDGDKVRGHNLLELAVKNGGKKLDSFAGNHRFYTRNGFEPVSWCEFNEEFAPDGWEKGAMEPEDIVFYKYTGKKKQTTWEDVRHTVKKFTGEDAYDLAMKYRDEEVPE